MVIDARTLPHNHVLQADICIIGAGAAGISLAMEFIGGPYSVLLLESGGVDPDPETQSLYKGTTVGMPYVPLDSSRLRYFGGTTNHWGGMCFPFDESDFTKRDWIPHSGWPFPKSTIDPFYKRAARVIQLPTEHWDSDSWMEPDNPQLPFVSERVITIANQQAPYEARRLGRVYRDKIFRADGITTCLYANVTELETNEYGTTVVGIRGATLVGTTFSVKANIVVLAAGAIENARLLLLSNKTQSAGLGNQNDLVGRFFMEIPMIPAAIFQPTDSRLRTRFYGVHEYKDSILMGELALSRDIQRQEKLTSVRIGLDTVYDKLYADALNSKGAASFRYLRGRLLDGDVPDEFGTHLRTLIGDLYDVAVATYGELRFGGNYPIDHVTLGAGVEPVPNRNSRVSLASDRDSLGQRRVQLDWRLSPSDKHSIRRTAQIVGMELGRAGLGRVKITVQRDFAIWPADIGVAFHHMGTTRMSEHPKEGVVDGNCKVHGVSNLFIAGSSVFPTTGSGTPTFMLIALALRLADHIKANT
jgi:choline dehydrogenase-like flavoprotein